MSNDLLIIKPKEGARKRRKRLGCGPGSGQGKTAGRGHRGTGARSGGKVPPWFEGGQMPLVRRVPKRGFHNPFKKEFALVKVGELKCFPQDSTVDVDVLKEAGLVRKRDKLIKLLGNGKIDRPLRVKVHRISRGARKKIEDAGGAWEEMT